jgi:hypothetical protein
MSLINLFVFSLPDWMKDIAHKFTPFPLDRRNLLLGFLTTSLLISVASLIFLASLPSDSTNDMIFNYSSQRILLMAGPAALSLSIFGLLVFAVLNRDWSSQLAERIFNNVKDIYRYTNVFLVITYSLILLILLNKPDGFPVLNVYHAERLLPYYILPPIFTAIFYLTARLSKNIKPRIVS